MRGDLIRILATLLGVSAGLTGLVASYHLELPTGPPVVLAAAVPVALAACRQAVLQTRTARRCEPSDAGIDVGARVALGR